VVSGLLTQSATTRTLPAPAARRTSSRAPVAVIDLKPNLVAAWINLRIVVEGSDVDAFREQALRHDLAESAESDEQSRAAHAVEIVGVRARRRGKAD